MTLDPEVKRVLIEADSLASLIAYRFPTGLDAETVGDLKRLSQRARKIYEADAGEVSDAGE